MTMTRQAVKPAPKAVRYIPGAANGAYPIRPGNLVRPLIDGVPAFRRIGEAIRQARRSVWLTVTFYAEDFRFPDGQEGLFDVLDDLVARGVDVRVLFWRPNPESSGYGRTFPGSPADRDMLRRRGSRFSVRWDRAAGPFCQHQKSWIIDAGEATETAFIGGINLTAANLGLPGHRRGAGDAAHGERHDLYVEVAGPCATDVHHNFVQRWNEASERAADDGTWGEHGSAALVFPTALTPPRGDCLAQVQRMVAPGRYTDGTATPGGAPHDIAAGERSVLEQYLRAIDAAQRSIYIENQALPVPEVAARIEAALERGVEVVYLVPADPEEHVRAARRNPERRAFFERIERLGRHEAFTLAGLATGPVGSGHRTVYVHAKIMLVDDAWATIGSCNLHAYSLSGHTEMNLSLWDAGIVRSLRRALLSEHLGQETDGLDDRAALRLYRQTAINNRACSEPRDDGWQGLAVALEPAEYGM